MEDNRLQLLERTKFLVRELQNVQELYYDTLVSEIGIEENKETFLFNYIFNSEESSMEEFLKKYSLTVSDILDE